MMPGRLLAGILLIGSLLAGATARASLKPVAPRQVVSLDGTWQIAEGALDAPPKAFQHTVPVPGLVDLAQPAFQDVGRKSPLRQAFWYRRTFKTDGPVPARAVLKIHKAMFGTRVLLNGQLVGDHVPCFTPAYLDVARHLRTDGRENELVVRVGADRESVPTGVPSGWDFEKYLYVPGIYDSVELILTGAPYIANVQTVPDLPGKSVRVVAEIEAPEGADLAVSAEVSETRSGKPAASAKSATTRPTAGGKAVVDLTIPLSDVRLWSPEDPFLYSLTIRTPGDAATVRFGMRSFSFDPQTRRALLNGQPYYLRGTNVTLYRFFEDAKRGDLPWRVDWVRRLHQSYKPMHWNSIRYCIGFPPEFWYDIADEEGFLIQDEFPIWLLNRKPEWPTAEHIIPQYTQWMRERWNHPCVVLWDAQNESETPETGKAIAAVRHLDLSNRPWDNGWEAPQAPSDSTEAHPYLFIRTDRSKGKNPFRLSEMPTVDGTPQLHRTQKQYGGGIIVNEYDWLWLTRDGQPTVLTKHVYDSLLPPGATADQRRQIHARYVAALTEFWRARRACAGVLHFCGLGYSRPGDKPIPEGGATSDDFIDLERLVFEPHFERHVRDAFSPVGIMLDFWADRATPSESRELAIVVTNDLPREWTGQVRLTLAQGPTAVVTCESERLSVPGYGNLAIRLPLKFPAAPGRYTVTATLITPGAPEVHSLRDVEIAPATPPAN